MNRNLILGALLTSVFLLSASVPLSGTPFSHNVGIKGYPGKQTARRGRGAPSGDRSLLARLFLSMIMVGARKPSIRGWRWWLWAREWGLRGAAWPLGRRPKRGVTGG